MNYELNGLIAIGLYWFPMIVCAYGYTVRTWTNYQKEILKRNQTDRYYGSIDTWGTVIGRGLITIVPLANLLATVFDIGPKLIGDFLSWISDIFDIPLVPEKDERQITKEVRR